jgi:hypothetical protein
VICEVKIELKQFMSAASRLASGALLLLWLASGASAQGAAQAQPRLRDVSQDNPPSGTQNAKATQQTAKPAPKTHRFWDRENILLFSGVGLARGLDYASTLNIRRRGINEIFLTNGIVDNHPLFASIEAAGTGASIGLSYIFHATGHHTLERWTSIVHIGVGIGGAGRNYLLKTPHPQ